ncbi:MAG TPA: type II toxin-antitoxin system CcdA family antitoxin [Azospirillaceae bacterium]|nr:type II toxin-antitoxin system CcdA family antitoxin [Azospirillaceae bacterium]
MTDEKPGSTAPGVAPDPGAKPGESAADRWRRENADAIEAANRLIERYGLPLERFRQF